MLLFCSINPLVFMPVLITALLGRCDSGFPKDTHSRDPSLAWQPGPNYKKTHRLPCSICTYSLLLLGQGLGPAQPGEGRS